MIEANTLQMVPGKQPWTQRVKYLLTHLDLRILACTIIIPILQMRKLRLREVN